ncbi:hypothetical protein DL546_002966 [Coniochaeta pulveracea]|uniref:Extracellular membrane protein CFEM domain-containing protein n=1 Tax=Coniochaeta pulveracea TaxID=177199 RepID=A0A420Y5J9_9PEZI|nr:hypothetical protein DL546_002966 [Coniochaeta pulveracea]
MRLSYLAILGQAAGLVYASSKCTPGNNCQRALSATLKRNPLADCSSYFQVTVTPATVTMTVTGTSISSATATETDVFTAPTTVTSILPIGKRFPGGQNMVEVRQVTVSASSIPAYASPCSSAAAYSSACSCIGATPTTVTAAAPVTTITVSTTVATTLTTTTSTTSFVPVATQTACPDGSVSINGACSQPACTSYARCPGTTSSVCVCFADVDDRSVHFCGDITAGSACSDYPSCSTQADCSIAGSICLVGACGTVCIPAATANCANTSSPSRLFRMRREVNNGLLIPGGGMGE